MSRECLLLDGEIRLRAVFIRLLVIGQSQPRAPDQDQAVPMIH